MKPKIAERLTIQDTQAFPLSTTLLHTVPEEIYKVDDSAEWIEEWWKHTDQSTDVDMVPEEKHEEQVVTDTGNEKPWKYDKGKGLENMSPDEPNTQTDTLWAMSDGGVINAGTYCTMGGYGYVIRSNKPIKAWGNFDFTMSGRGMVEGNNLYIDSTRAEARGLLGTMTRILSSLESFQKVKQIDHATDNEAVVNTYSGLKERSSADWLRSSDSDIWHEIQQAEEKFANKGIMYQVRWVRSHPERRLTWLAEWTVDDVLNSMADSLATLAIQEYVGKGNTNLIPARDSKRVWYAYTQAIGGEKMRITGNLRQMLKTHIKQRHYYSYLEKTKASHIQGQNLHNVIDYSLLRKMCKPPATCTYGQDAKNPSGYTGNGNCPYAQESWYLNKWK